MFGQIQFIYSEKATRIWRNIPIYMTFAMKNLNQLRDVIKHKYSEDMNLDSLFEFYFSCHKKQKMPIYVRRNLYWYVKRLVLRTKIWKIHHKAIPNERQDYSLEINEREILFIRKTKTGFFHVCFSLPLLSLHNCRHHFCALADLWGLIYIKSFSLTKFLISTKTCNVSAKD